MCNFVWMVFHRALGWMNFILKLFWIRVEYLLYLSTQMSFFFLVSGFAGKTIVVTKIFYNFLFEVSCVYLHVNFQIMPRLKSKLHFGNLCSGLTLAVLCIWHQTHTYTHSVGIIATEEPCCWPKSVDTDLICVIIFQHAFFFFVVFACIFLALIKSRSESTGLHIAGSYQNWA